MQEITHLPRCSHWNFTAFPVAETKKRTTAKLWNCASGFLDCWPIHWLNISSFWVKKLVKNVLNFTEAFLQKCRWKTWIIFKGFWTSGEKLKIRWKTAEKLLNFSPAFYAKNFYKIQNIFHQFFHSKIWNVQPVIILFDLTNPLSRPIASWDHPFIQTVPLKFAPVLAHITCFWHISDKNLNGAFFWPKLNLATRKWVQRPSRGFLAGQFVIWTWQQAPLRLEFRQKQFDGQNFGGVKVMWHEHIVHAPYLMFITQLMHTWSCDGIQHAGPTQHIKLTCHWYCILQILQCSIPSVLFTFLYLT